MRGLSRKATCAWIAIPHGAATLLLGAALPASAQDAVPFTIHTQRAAIMVDVMAAGRPLRLVVDTGSKTTIVHYKSVGLSDLDLKPARTAGAATRGVALPIRSMVTLGSRSRERTLAAMDLSEVQKLFGERVDGIVGMDLLMECGAVTLDFERRLLHCGR